MSDGERVYVEVVSSTWGRVLARAIDAPDRGEALVVLMRHLVAAELELRRVIIAQAAHEEPPGD